MKRFILWIANMFKPRAKWMELTTEQRMWVHLFHPNQQINRKYNARID